MEQKEEKETKDEEKHKQNKTNFDTLSCVLIINSFVLIMFYISKHTICYVKHCFQSCTENETRAGKVKRLIRIT